MCGRFVVNHFWEPSDPRLFVCEAKLLPDTSKPPLSSSLLINKASSGQVRLQVGAAVRPLSCSLVCVCLAGRLTTRDHPAGCAMFHSYCLCSSFGVIT